MMDWQGRIVADPDTLFGKPRIAGTRIGVEFVLDLLALGWTEAQILDSYPRLKPEDLQAIFAFARDCLKDKDSIMGVLLKASRAEAVNAQRLGDESPPRPKMVRGGAAQDVD